MLHDALYNLLSPVSAKSFPGIAPELTEIPYIVFFQISNTPSPDASGESTLDELTYQVSVFASSYREMETMAASVRTAMDEFSGTDEGVTIERISFRSENYIPEGNGVHHKAIDYTITVKR